MVFKNPRVRVHGAKKLRRTMTAAGDDMTELKAANRKAAETAARASASLAPKLSGALAATIRASGTKTAGVIRAGRKSVPYAAPIHWGWPTRPDPLNQIYGAPIKAQPFLSDGATSSEGQWLPEYVDTMNGIIRRVEGT